MSLLAAVEVQDADRALLGIGRGVLEISDHAQWRTQNISYAERDRVRRRGAAGDVLIRGGRFFQTFTEAKLVGSSLGGGFLKQFGIYVGLRLKLHVDGETIVTAPVFSISICPMDLAASA